MFIVAILFLLITHNRNQIILGFMGKPDLRYTHENVKTNKLNLISLENAAAVLSSLIVRENHTRALLD